jgi:predicted CXXCH cytochrome family protein
MIRPWRMKIVVLVAFAAVAPAAMAGKKGGKPAGRVLEKVPGAIPIGSATCRECHEDAARFYEGSLHHRPFFESVLGRGCESCHGPGSLHAETADKARIVNREDLQRIAAQERSSLCLSCHFANLLAKRDAFFSQHARAEVSCWDCHEDLLHHLAAGGRPQPRKAFLPDAKEGIVNLFGRSQNEYCYRCHETQRMEFALPFRHPLERGKMACTDCHDPHGDPWRNQLVTHSIDSEADALCFRCHTEQRGPFVWQHQAIEEGCTKCHKPHGSPNRRLLVVSGNALCLQCHFETRFPAIGQSAHDFKLSRRARCVDCHIRPHGSNVSEDLTQ